MKFLRLKCEECLIRFCGWVDVDLSPLGEAEAVTAAEAIADSGIEVNQVFTSLLRRARTTVDEIVKVL